MRDPGPVPLVSPEYETISWFARFLAEQFGMREGPALGQLLRFYDGLRKATQHPLGMASLVIEIRDEPTPPVTEESEGA